MSDTPIIDAATKAIWECDEQSAWDSIALADCRNAAIAALRAANPWTPSAEEIEAMAGDEHDEFFFGPNAKKWKELSPVERAPALARHLRRYRQRPIMPELYDNDGAPR